MTGLTYVLIVTQAKHYSYSILYNCGVDNLIIFGAKYLIFGIVFMALVIWATTTTKNRWQFATAVALAGITAFMLFKITGALYYHPRPFVVEHIKPLISHGNDNSFPSEHTLLAMTLSAVIYYYRPRLALGLFGLTLLVGISRVLAHVHSPVDILGSLILGALAGWAGYQLAKKLLPGSKQTATDQQKK